MPEFLTHPFTLGLALGMLLSLTFVVNVLWRSFVIRKENQKLKDSLSTKFSIEAESTERMKKDFEGLKKENENLRITVEKLMQKPKREDIRLLQVYDRAIAAMQEKAPGFAQAWQVYLRESEESMEGILTGKLPFVGRRSRPASTKALPPSEMSAENEG